VTERTLSGYFCDDIREEVGGKTSLIGCYGPELAVPDFPVTLSKLCAAVIVRSPAAKPFKELRIVVLQGDEEVAAAEIPAAALEEMAVLFADSPDRTADATHAVGVNFVMSPVKVEAPCVFRVRATADGQVVKGLAIKITSKEGRTLESVKGVVENKAAPRKRSRSSS